MERLTRETRGSVCPTKVLRASVGLTWDRPTHPSRIRQRARTDTPTHLQGKRQLPGCNRCGTARQRPKFRRRVGRWINWEPATGSHRCPGPGAPCKGPLFQQVRVLSRQRSSRPGSYPSGCGGNEVAEAWEKEG